MYVILDGLQQVLYVGKGVVLEKRLAAYFSYSADCLKRCRVKGKGWTARPEYLVVIPLPEETLLELEGCLISELQPPSNKLGVH